MFKLKKIVTLCLWSVYGTMIAMAGQADATTQTLYYGGDIITMEGEAPVYVEALVQQNGKIIFIGSKAEAFKKYKGTAKEVNLQGKTLLPGFIDGHSHFYNVGFVAQLTNLQAPPDGPCDNITHIIDAVNKWKESDDGKATIKTFGWILGHGYDDSQLQKKEHPTASDLDKISTDIPILLIHQSEHLGVVNHKALELLGYNKETKDPEGGHIRKDKEGNPTGVLEEKAMFSFLFPLLGKADTAYASRCIAKSQIKYAQNGYLTVQDGRTTSDQMNLFDKAAQNKQFYLDIVSYPDIDGFNFDIHQQNYSKNTYKNHYRVGGVKLVLDGSPQGKTAWLTMHYHRPPQGKNTKYKGFPIMSKEKANAYVSKAFKNKWQIIAHTNGDAAIDQYLNAIENAQKKYNYSDHRTVIIHGQTIRKDQILRAAKLNVDASLFPMHTFYWGDWHVESVLGHPRADYISPMVDAIKAGLNVTSHHDAPVTFPKSMRVLDATVNRVTRSGYILGSDQKLSPFDGLRTLTTWAAYQYFEEDSKGTLSIGKLADLVILDKNPLKIDPMQIHTIKVVEAIKEGKSVYTLK